MGYTIEIKKPNLIVHFYGELDHHITEKSRLLIDQKYKDNNLRNIIIDLTQLTLMDSSGIGLVMGRYKLVNSNGGRIVLVSSNTYIDRIIKMSGLLKIIEVYMRLEDALTNLER
ncbi:MAG: anti-sigma factor antagonist [Tissierellia bacterium]|nr:anti-sigma factor antagonist [Tissierellia bacterium]